MTSGWLNIDKPTGPSSHDVVAQVRRRYEIRRVGHAGTLDPMATGVLLVGLGGATRLMSFATAANKEYVARLRLGMETDSEDTTGAVVREADASTVTAPDLEHAAARFRGEILQTPPMVSAVKHQGKRLYELARRGEVVERAPRPVTIYALRIDDFTPGAQAEATLHVECSSGTYIRTLCADIGRELGCGGCMAALRRTRVGGFRIEESATLDALESGDVQPEPVWKVVSDFPAVVLDEESERIVTHGGWIPAAEQAGRLRSQVRLMSQSGELVAMAHTLEMADRGLRWQPFIVVGNRE